MQSVGGTAFGFHVVPRHVLGRGFIPPGETPNIAGIGVGGQGGGVTRDMAGQNIVTFCDVDENKAAGTFEAFPKAERFRDDRVLLDKRPRWFRHRGLRGDPGGGVATPGLAWGRRSPIGSGPRRDAFAPAGVPRGPGTAEVLSGPF